MRKHYQFFGDVHISYMEERQIAELEGERGFGVRM